ncbi:MAG: hypothetical protein AAFR16_12565, partial [Pseudomonadota bacterium]
HAAALGAVLERVLTRARSFCALKVTAPASFFDDGAFEVRLRRRMTDGCRLEQVAQLACGALTRTERILPADD